ncbi:nucleoside diphosphate-linked moiety X motif 17 isoform X2 [Paramormyrops kingsleyae]|uniref:nucleoside diphosphate-linked moiety X motif 17 isoform X2 n=1 Tax=Paramormyrops kingsleyae TaxID=1676925 RepID=UPI003B9785E1
MEKVRRVLVYLSKESSVPECARFVQSITGHFADSETDLVEVSCSLENNRFILYGQDGGKRGPGVMLKRASFCPFKHISKSEAAALPVGVQSRGVDVGVVVLLQSANQKLLLTRRAAGMSIFPNVWVPPGGHIEFDEKMVDAGLRELREETGLKINQEDISSQILGLWEASLRPEPAEVSGCLWVDAEIVKGIVSAVDGEEDAGKLPENLPQTVSMWEVSPEGRLCPSVLPVSILCSRALAVGEDVERVSTGTKFALELWLKTMEPQR